MKKKFEDNVAGSMPKTKTDEPSLPWKIDEADLAAIEIREEDFAALSSGEAPLKTRPVFLVILVVAVFFAALYMVAVMAGENENIKLDISTKEKEAARLQVDLDKISTEKATIEKSSAQLEKRVDDLAAQKELFTAVLESLTKKNSATEIAGEAVKEPAAEAASASGENAANVQ